MSGLGFLGGLLKGLTQGDITKKQLNLRERSVATQEGWLQRALDLEPYQLDLMREEIEKAKYNNAVLNAIDPKVNAWARFWDTLTGRQGVPGVTELGGSNMARSLVAGTNQAVGSTVLDPNAIPANVGSKTDQQIKVAKEKLRNKKQEIGYELQKEATIEEIKHKNKIEENRLKEYWKNKYKNTSKTSSSKLTTSVGKDLDLLIKHFASAEANNINTYLDSDGSNIPVSERLMQVKIEANSLLEDPSLPVDKKVKVANILRKYMKKTLGAKDPYKIINEMEIEMRKAIDPNYKPPKEEKKVNTFDSEFEKVFGKNLGATIPHK